MAMEDQSYNVTFGKGTLEFYGIEASIAKSNYMRRLQHVHYFSNFSNIIDTTYEQHVLGTADILGSYIEKIYKLVYIKKARKLYESAENTCNNHAHNHNMDKVFNILLEIGLNDYVDRVQKVARLSSLIGMLATPAYRRPLGTSIKRLFLEEILTNLNNYQDHINNIISNLEDFIRRTYSVHNLDHHHNIHFVGMIDTIIGMDNNFREQFNYIIKNFIDNFFDDLNIEHNDPIHVVTRLFRYRSLSSYLGLGYIFVELLKNEPSQESCGYLRDIVLMAAEALLVNLSATVTSFYKIIDCQDHNGEHRIIYNPVGTNKAVIVEPLGLHNNNDTVECGNGEVYFIDRSYNDSFYRDYKIPCCLMSYNPYISESNNARLQEIILLSNKLREIILEELENANNDKEPLFFPYSHFKINMIQSDMVPSAFQLDLLSRLNTDLGIGISFNSDSLDDVILNIHTYAIQIFDILKQIYLKLFNDPSSISKELHIRDVFNEDNLKKYAYIYYKLIAKEYKKIHTKITNRLDEIHGNLCNCFIELARSFGNLLNSITELIDNVSNNLINNIDNKDEINGIINNIEFNNLIDEFVENYFLDRINIYTNKSAFILNGYMNPIDVLVRYNPPRCREYINLYLYSIFKLTQITDVNDNDSIIIEFLNKCIGENRCISIEKVYLWNPVQGIIKSNFHLPYETGIEPVLISSFNTNYARDVADGVCPCNDINGFYHQMQCLNKILFKGPVNYIRGSRLVFDNLISLEGSPILPDPQFVEGLSYLGSEREYLPMRPIPIKENGMGRGIYQLTPVVHLGATLVLNYAVKLTVNDCEKNGGGAIMIIHPCLAWSLGRVLLSFNNV